MNGSSPGTTALRWLATSVATGQAVYRDFRANRSIRLGAGLAFYGLFALAPLLTLSMALATVVFDDEEVNDYLTEVITDVIGASNRGAAEDMVDQLNTSADSFSLGLIGFGTLIVGASLVFVAIEDAFNSIWDQPVRPGFRHAVVKRLRAFTVVLGAAALVIVGLVLQAIASLVENLVPGRVDPTTNAAAGIGTLASVLTLAAALGLLYHELGPDHLRWRPAAIGGVATAVAMTVGSVALAAYLTGFGANSVRDATTGALFALLWIYYQAQILLAGAHLVRVLNDDQADPDHGP